MTNQLKNAKTIVKTKIKDIQEENVSALQVSKETKVEFADQDYALTIVTIALDHRLVFVMQVVSSIRILANVKQNQNAPTIQRKLKEFVFVKVAGI